MRRGEVQAQKKTYCRTNAAISRGPSIMEHHFCVQHNLERIAAVKNNSWSRAPARTRTPPVEPNWESLSPTSIVSPNCEKKCIVPIRLRRCISHPGANFLWLIYLHSWISAGSKKVGVGNISPRAFRRRIVRCWQPLGCRAIDRC